MIKRLFGSTGVLFALLLTSQSATAQEFLRDRRYQEGIGIRTGDLELHPGVAGEVGYDSNWFLRSNGTGYVNSTPALAPEGAGVIRITPSLTLSTLGPQRREGDVNYTPPSVRFRGGISGTYREFLSSDATLRDQRNVSGAADARLEIAPERPFGAALFANYTRTIQPTVIGNPDLSFNRDDVGAGGELIVVPGGGTLDWRFGYQFRDVIFEQTEGQGFDNITHEANTRGRWKFRPRTALLYDATLRFINYTNTGSGLHDSTPVRARIGLNGLVTPRFSVLGMVGYGASFYATGGNSHVPQYDSVIGQAEAKWFLTGNPGADQPGAISLALSSIAVGYVRDFQNSYLGDFYGSDRGYAKISYFFAGRALLSLEGGLGAVEYPTILNPADGSVRHSSFTDLRADATLFGEYRFSDTFGLNATVRYTQNFSNTQLPVTGLSGTGTGTGTGTATGNGLYDMSWQRVEAFLGARWFM